MLKPLKPWILPLMMPLLCSPARAQEDAAPQETVLDEIVAKVNQDIITLTDLNQELRTLRNSLQEQYEDPARLSQEFERSKLTLLKNLIQNRVLLQKADELGVNPDSDVEQAIQRMMEQMGIPSLQVFEQALQQRGLTLQEYRRNLKERFTIDYLVQQMVYSDLVVMTPEIEEFYQQHIDQFTEPPEVELAEILFLSEGKDKAEVRSRAEEVVGKLRSGQLAFEELAREYSEGPTASRAGNIGWFKRGSLSEAVEAVVFSLEPEQVSELTETDYGFQILKVLDKKSARIKPLEEIRKEIQNRLYQQKAQPKLKAFIEDLIQQSYIYIAPKYREEYDVDGL